MPKVAIWNFELSNDDKNYYVLYVKTKVYHLSFQFVLWGQANLYIRFMKIKQ